MFGVNMKSSEETYSVRSMSVPSSIMSETKEKFDELLKASKKNVRKKNRQLGSKEELLKVELESATSSEDVVENLKLAGDSKSYIMEKFLNTTEEEIIAVAVIDEKAPVPKPRKKIKEIVKSPTISQGTYKVNRSASISSNRTYQVEEVGDVLIHNSPLHPKISIKTHSERFLEKGETETLSDNSSVSKIPRPKERASKKETIIDTKFTYEKIVEVVIHKTDRLLLNSLVVHPVVKIQLVDADTGKFLKKSDPNRSVVFFYENKEQDFVCPIMTHAFNLQENRTLVPSWEESILLNEDYNYLLEKKSQVIFFFEIIDFIPSALQSNQKDFSKGWHNIAFAFLKLSGKNGALNIGQKLRLQLYYSYKSDKKNDPFSCKAWTWWKKKKLQKYPSTLYVSVKPVISPKRFADALRSKTPVQEEKGPDLFEPKMTRSNTFVKSTVDEAGDRKTSSWARLPHETCKIPNKCLARFDSNDEGCFVMKFSHSGEFLACALKRNNLFCITLYSVLLLEEIQQLAAHQGMIYCIRWSFDDLLIISASADHTIAIFNRESYALLQILPHPSFVYCCDINKEYQIVSGCFDGVLRIWSHSTGEQRLFQELESHKGYVTTVCFGSSRLYSGDSLGEIKVWKKDGLEWKLFREISLLHIKGTTINQILLFQKEKRLLVHSRDSSIRIIDVKSGCVLHSLNGALNKRVQMFCSISPCGTFVFSGSENGLLHAWNAKSGKDLASYHPYKGRNLPVHCVEFHPQDNILTLSHYGEALPVLVYFYDKESEDGELKLNSNGDTSRNSLIRSKGASVNSSVGQNGDKIDFRSVLRKMDDVIQASQTSE